MRNCVLRIVYVLIEIVNSFTGRNVFHYYRATNKSKTIPTIHFLETFHMQSFLDFSIKAILSILNCINKNTVCNFDYKSQLAIRHNSKKHSFIYQSYPLYVNSSKL